MESGKAIARPGYLLAAMFFVIPLLETLKTVWPMNPNREQWRFGAVGTLSNFVLTPLLAILIAMTLALTCDHRRLRRILAWMCYLVAAILAALAVLFVRDLLQIRSTVLPQFRRTMDVTSATVLCKLLLTITTLVLFGRIGIGRKGGWHRRSGQDAPTPLIPTSGAARDSTRGGQSRD